MSATSAWFYFLLMCPFIAEAWVLSGILPFHRIQGTKELSLARVVPLDGLRGILALSVFFLHVTEFRIYETTGKWLPPVSNFYRQLGVMPVCMFFFITGYVFWLKLTRSTHIPLGQFIYARWARLSGVYFLACLLCFGLVAVESGFHSNISPAKLTFQVLAWLSFFGSGHDMNQIAGSRLWLGPAWTLRFEWMFYLSLPFLGWFAARKRRLPILLGVAAGLGFLLYHLPAGGAVKKAITDQFAPYMDFVAYTFSVGIVTAVLKIGPKLKSWMQGNVGTAISFALIAVTLFFAKPEFGWAESLLLAVPFVCVCSGNTWLGLLTSSPIRFLGRISYSFYLLHVVLMTAEIAMVKQFLNLALLSPSQYWLLAGVSGAIAIFIAAISYQYLEYPFLHVGVKASATSIPQRQLAESAA